MEGRRGLPERDGGGRERLPFKAEKGALLRVRMRGLGRETERERHVMKDMMRRKADQRSLFRQQPAEHSPRHSF